MQASDGLSIGGWTLSGRMPSSVSEAGSVLGWNAAQLPSSLSDAGSVYGAGLGGAWLLGVGDDDAQEWDGATQATQ